MQVLKRLAVHIDTSSYDARIGVVVCWLKDNTNSRKLQDYKGMTDIRSYNDNVASIIVAVSARELYCLTYSRHDEEFALGSSWRVL